MTGLGAFVSRFKTDLLMMHRSGFVAAVAVVAAILIVLVRYAIPAEPAPSVIVYAVDETAGARVQSALSGEIPFLDGEAVLGERIGANPRARGIVFRETAGTGDFALHVQGYESEEERRTLEMVATDLWRRSQGGEGGMPAVVEIAAAGARPPLNLGLVPMVLGLEVAVVGLFLASVMIFQEKADGTLKAYRVSPGGVWLYLVSKIAATSALAFVYGTAMYAATLGFAPGYLAAISLVLLASVLVTSAGILLGAYFEGLSDFVYVMVFVAILLGLPAIAYLAPSLHLPGMSLIPTHPLIFGLRETIFPGGREYLMPRVWAVLGGGAILFTVAARAAVGRRLMSEVRR